MNDTNKTFYTFFWITGETEGHMSPSPMTRKQAIAMAKRTRKGSKRFSCAAQLGNVPPSGMTIKGSK